MGNKGMNIETQEDFIQVHTANNAFYKIYK